MSIKKILGFIFGIALTIFFSWLIAKQLDWQDISQALIQTNLFWIVLAVLIYFVGFACRIERMKLMMLCDNPTLKWKECFGPTFISMTVSNLLPFRAGDLVRAFGFNRRLKITVATSIATMAIERMCDLLAIILLLGLALPFFQSNAIDFLGRGSFILIGVALFITVIFLFPQSFAPPFMKIFLWASKFMPKIGKPLLNFASKAFDALFHITHKGVIWRVLGWSLLAWIGQGLLFWFCALAMPVVTSPAGAWLAMPIGSLSTIIPSAPGSIGTFDYFVLEAMKLDGNSIIAAASYAFVVHLVIWLPSTIVGVVALLLHPFSKQEKLDLNASREL